MNQPLPSEGTSEAVILVPSALQRGAKATEIRYAIALTMQGELLRLYPLNETISRARRWDQIRFRWKKPAKDTRQESREIIPESVQALEPLVHERREGLIEAVVTKDFLQQSAAGKTLAIVRPERILLMVKRKTAQEVALEVQLLQQIAQKGAEIPPPTPYHFHYRFADDGGHHELTVEDAEINESCHQLSKSLGDALAISRMMQVWGKDNPHKGLLFVVSRATAVQWLINAVLCTDEIEDMSARAINLMA